MWFFSLASTLFLYKCIGENKNAEPIESSDSRRVRHNEQETVGNFVKVFLSKKEQYSEISLQICSQFSWKWKNARSNPLLRLKRQNVIYGFTLKIFSSRYAKKSEKSDFFGLSSILYNRDVCLVQNRWHWKMPVLRGFQSIHCLESFFIFTVMTFAQTSVGQGFFSCIIEITH